MLVFVLVYFVVVFVTFAFADMQVRLDAGAAHIAARRASIASCISSFLVRALRVQIARLICQGWVTNDCYVNTLKPLDEVFYVIDMIFLTLFLVEITAKFFGLGMIYFKDALNAADSLIIFVSIVMTLLVLSTNILDAASGATSLLPLFKVIRLLRVVLVMTRLQRSRERYRRMKMVGLAAPVEKVFEIIGELRRKARDTPHATPHGRATRRMAARDTPHTAHSRDRPRSTHTLARRVLTLLGRARGDCFLGRCSTRRTTRRWRGRWT